MTCGGIPSFLDHNEKTCMVLGPKGWTITHNLTHARTGHVSFTTSQGTLLMGGEGLENHKSSELVKQDGYVEPGFELKHRIQ